MCKHSVPTPIMQQEIGPCARCERERELERIRQASKGLADAVLAERARKATPTTEGAS